MPNIAAGIGLLGLGVMVVVAVGTIAYSLFNDQPPFSYEYEDGSYSRRNERSSDPRRLKPKTKRKQRTSSAFMYSDPCSICKETIEIDVSKKLPCDHCFHHQCIRDWFESCTSFLSLSQPTGSCPMCRRKFSSQDII